jgi:hypothetical protein
LLAGRPAFADEPDFIAWHALHAIVEHAMLMAIGYADTAGRKETGQPTFGASPPTDLFHFSSASKASAATGG